jgi:C_GCAxxG_C_C family probable redox protein
MWEAYELGNEDLLWSCIAFTGGIAGQQQAPCGAISASAVCLGLHYRCPPADKQKAKQSRLDARQDANKLVAAFTEKFGSITCRDLIGLDFSKPEEYRRFQESDISKEKCDKFVQFVIEKLYEFDEKRSSVKIPEKVVIYTSANCPPCDEAKKDLEERGVPYEEISIEGNPRAVEEVMRLSNGTGIVPIIVTGQEVKIGFGCG